MGTSVWCKRMVDLAMAQTEASEQDLIVRTNQAYFDVLAAQETLTFVTAQKAAVAEQVGSAKRNFAVGTHRPSPMSPTGI